MISRPDERPYLVKATACAVTYATTTTMIIERPGAEREPANASATVTAAAIARGAMSMAVARFRGRVRTG